jgi:glycosyltransferase involved in cell wall biosynthesis
LKGEIVGSRSQKDIVSAWDNKVDILVSIVCATYNHERYLESAINGFLNQRTTFPLEIIIHDDASTDGTAQIIKAYCKKYPKLIQPIYQTENQYSNGFFKPTVYAAGFAKGKYIAFCEGDDYWIDHNKIQRQVESLERNDDIDFSFHAAYLAVDGEKDLRINWRYGKTRVITISELLDAGAGSFAPTCSYVIRKRVLEKLPPWFYTEAPVGDFFIERYGALRGGAHYISEPMSVYRQLTPGSWTLNVEGNQEVFKNYLRQMSRALDLMSEDFADYPREFNKFYARYYLNYAVKELLLGQKKSFSELMMKSGQKWRYVSLRHMILYRLRNLPTLAKLSLSFFRKISR